MQIIEKKLSEIKPYRNNAKKHDKDQIDKICASLEEFGWKQAIVIDINGEIVAGHGRYLAAKKLAKNKTKKTYKWNDNKEYNWNNVPCILADDLTEDQIKAYRLVDNEIFGDDYDYDIKLAEIDEIDLDLSAFGIEAFDMDDIEEVERGEGSGTARDKGEYFTATFVFPVDKKPIIETYLRKYKNAIISDTILI